jgi:hypothetical protein
LRRHDGEHNKVKTKVQLETKAYERNQNKHKLYFKMVKKRTKSASDIFSLLITTKATLLNF